MLGTDNNFSILNQTLKHLGGPLTFNRNTILVSTSVWKTKKDADEHPTKIRLNYYLSEYLGILSLDSIKVSGYPVLDNDWVINSTRLKDVSNWKKS